MKVSQKPTFASPELQKAFDEARPALEGLEDAMSRVSNDIRALETYLQSLSIKHEYRYSLGKGLELDDGQQDIGAMVQEIGSASGTVKEEALVWGADDKGRFRLMYELSCWDGCFDVDALGGPLFWDESSLRRDAKPIMETRFEIRKRMYEDHFADFVRSLGEHLRIKQIAAPDTKPVGDDIPV